MRNLCRYARVLVEHGANPSAVDASGVTPIGVCEANGGGGYRGGGLNKLDPVDP